MRPDYFNRLTAQLYCSNLAKLTSSTWYFEHSMAANEANMDYGAEDLKQNILRYFLYRWDLIRGIMLT